MTTSAMNKLFFHVGSYQRFANPQKIISKYTPMPLGAHVKLERVKSYLVIQGVRELQRRSQNRDKK